MTDEAKSAESSAAAVAEPTFNPQDQYTWSDEQKEHWNKTGEQPTSPKTQESEPAAKPAKEATSDNAAESETASTQGKKERKPGEKLSRDERISQLTAENRELKAERERSRVAEPKPPVQATEPAKQPDAPKRPNPFTWTGTKEEYDAAFDAYDAHQRRQAIAEFQQSESVKAQNQKLQGELDAVKAKYPDADGKIKETLAVFSKTQFPAAISAMLNDSECLPELIYVLSDEATRNHFIETATKNPGKAIRALAQMEVDIAKQAEAEPKSETKPSADPKPRAPKPPSEVGGRGAAGEDALRTAAQAGDFRAFEAEQSRRKFAKAS